MKKRFANQPAAFCGIPAVLVGRDGLLMSTDTNRRHRMPNNKADRISWDLRGSQFWRFRWLLVSAVLLVEVGCFTEVFVRAVGEEGFKALVLLALGAFMLSLFATGLRNVNNG